MSDGKRHFGLKKKKKKRKRTIAGLHGNVGLSISIIQELSK